MSYVWRFGDGNTLSGQANPSHVYNTTGIYDVTLIASSSDGCTDSVVNKVEIPNVNINSSINAPDTACVNQPVVFTNISTPSADSSGWKFGDGTENTGNSVSKTYTAPGTYNVKLTNLFGSCLDSVIKTITILDVPQADFTSADTVNCRAPFTVRFTDQSTGAISWLWNFGDGTSSSERNPTRDYTTLGRFDVSLTITNRNGCTSTRVKKEFVKLVPPSITFFNLPDSGCAPITIRPQANIIAVDGVSSYFWTFGDGTTSTEATPTKTYSNTGTYNVTLAISTRGGCLQTISVPNAVKTGIKPAANFTGAPLDLCAGQPVNFLDLSTGQITGWRWDFGDTANRVGNSSTLRNPSYQYTDTGRFTVKLYVFNNGCVDSMVKPAYVRAYGAVARFGHVVSCVNKRQVSFLDSSLNATSIIWDFGDGSPTTTQPNPTHIFPALGTYNVTLTAVQGTCSFTLTKIIKLVDEKADFNITPLTLCRGATTTLTATAIDSNVLKYEWDYGNGIFVIGDSVFTHVYDTPRVYVARLALTDINGCTDTVTRNIAVGGPRARFVAINPTGCVGLTVDFNDNSISDGVNAIVSRVWDYGDGAVQSVNGQAVSHQYIIPGFFNVKLKVTDAVGCADSLVQNSLVVASNPLAAFSAADSSSCPGKNVQFLTQATGAIISHQWSFGDGNTSNLRNPQNAYLLPGVYDISLKVSDRFGCSDSTTKTKYILIDTPFASFTVSDSVANCPPLIAKFTNTSRYQQSIRWDFGDGDISVIDTPTHLYGLGGTYLARLIVTSPGGCTDTSFKKMTVFGPNGVLTATPVGGCLPATFDFRVRTTNTDSVFWDFTDGSPILIGRDTIQQHTYTDTAGDLKPRVLLQDATGCRVVVTTAAPIKVIDIKPGFNADKKLLCDNGLVNFIDTTRTNGAITSYEWDFGDGSKGSGPTPSHYYSGTGFYNVSLKITTELGCTDSVMVPQFIKSVNSPVAEILSADTACLNRFITYTGNLTRADTSAVTWAWDFGNGNTSALQNPLTQQYIIPGTPGVRLVVTNSSGCKDTVLKSVTIHPLPALNAGSDTTLCLGQSTTLAGSGAVSYLWLPPNASLSCTNCPNPVASPPITTTYRLRGTSVQGCQVEDTVKISVVQPSTVDAPPNDSLCLGQGMQLFATGTQLYSWSPATGLNNPNTSSPIARPTATTTYIVTGSDARGCFITRDSVTISVFPLPVFDLGPDVTIQVGSGTKFAPVISNDLVSIQWTPQTSLSCTDCYDPVASPKQKTQYTATVRNNGGCVITDEINVFVTCTNDNLFIPNTFSPNNDGMNEVFYPRGRGILAIKNMRIFSRWGQQVFWKQNFLANDASAGWDGRFKGVPLSADVYVYMIDVVCENNTVVTLKGDIMLTR
jgi:gliding motility-associated-like protein